jgi:mannitol-1-phosphate/altronate dehydrogenase
VQDKKVHARQSASFYLGLIMSRYIDIFGLMKNPSLSDSQREAIFAELASLHSIERGSLTEEYRERPASDGKGIVRNGPYFKHQCWENGRNRSRRVPLEEVPHLRDDLENGQRFDRLVDNLASLAIAESRERRAAKQADQKPGGDAKKNSAKRASAKDTAKPKPSSRRSPRASPKKDSKA